MGTVKALIDSIKNMKFEKDMYVNLVSVKTTEAGDYQAKTVLVIKSLIIKDNWITTSRNAFGDSPKEALRRLRNELRLEFPVPRTKWVLEDITDFATRQNFFRIEKMAFDRDGVSVEPVVLEEFPLSEITRRYRASTRVIVEDVTVCRENKWAIQKQAFAATKNGALLFLYDSIRKEFQPPLLFPLAKDSIGMLMDYHLDGTMRIKGVLTEYNETSEMWLAKAVAFDTRTDKKLRMFTFPALTEEAALYGLVRDIGNEFYNINNTFVLRVWSNTFKAPMYVKEFIASTVLTTNRKEAKLFLYDEVLDFPDEYLKMMDKALENEDVGPVTFDPNGCGCPQCRNK